MAALTPRLNGGYWSLSIVLIIDGDIYIIYIIREEASIFAPQRLRF